MLHRRCEKCHTVFATQPNEIRRGRALFCNKFCSGPMAQYIKIHGKFKRLCKTCNKPFQTIDPKLEYCCLECDPNEGALHSPTPRATEKKD